MRELTGQSEVFNQLNSLVGVWRGEGTGAFPTIDAFRYREILRFESSEVEPILHFEQKTWLITEGARDGEFLHWESGFLLVTEEGQIDLLNAQNSGRVEVLQGCLRVANDDEFDIHLSSVVHAHDPRMVGTARVLKYRADKISYSASMETTQVATMTQHLQGNLIRTG